MGSDDFTWGDCIALIENVTWDDPLFKAMKPNDWLWYDPSRDPMITVVDLLMQINAKTPMPPKMPRANLPKPVERPKPGGEVEKKSKVQGRSWDDMTEWLDTRRAKPTSE